MINRSCKSKRIRYAIYKEWNTPKCKIERLMKNKVNESVSTKYIIHINYKEI